MIYNLLKLYSAYAELIMLFSYIILCITSYLVLTFEITWLIPLIYPASSVIVAAVSGLSINDSYHNAKAKTKRWA